MFCRLVPLLLRLLKLSRGFGLKLQNFAFELVRIVLIAIAINLIILTAALIFTVFGYKGINWNLVFASCAGTAMLALIATILDKVGLKLMRGRKF